MIILDLLYKIKIHYSLLFIIAIALFPQIVVTQNCTLFGTVKDSIRGIGIAYAHIILVSDNENSQGGITDEKGNYKIDNLTYGNYNIKVLCLGYKTQIINDINFSPDHKKVKIDIFIDVDIKTLSEVEVVADRTSIELKSDRKIVHINLNEAAGSSVADFLKSLPEIKVEGDAVTLKTYEPTIFVNGKPAGPTMKDLTQVPASLISSVEVITNPSVRYNPEGLGGIINLKTRKMPEGINGMIQSNVASNNKYNGAATINFKTKKWNTFANIYERYIGGKKTQDLNQQFDSGSSFYQMRSDISKINRLGTRIGTDFEPDSTNIFTLFWEYGKRSGNLDNNTNCEEIGLFAKNIYEIEQKSKLDSRDHQICFNYIHTFKNEGELDINISQSFGYEPTNYNILYKDVSTSSFYSEDLYNGKESDIEINYSSKIFNTLNLETGTSFDWEKTKASELLFGTFVDGYNHIFDMDRLINAYYLSLGKNIGKFAIVSGLRGEYVYQKLNSAVYLSNKNNFDLFPNFGVNYNVNNEISLNLNYGRRISRPNIFGLTPYESINYNFLSQRFIGNPDLKPAYTNSIDLGQYFNWSKFSLSTSVSYMTTKNNIDFVYYLQDSLTYATRKNIANSQKILFNIMLDYHSKLFNIYRPILTARFGQDFYNSIDTNGNNIHKTFFNYHLNLYNLFFLPKDFIMAVNITYYPRTYMYSSTIDDKTNINLIIRKVLKSNLTLQLGFYNILNAKHIENVYGDGFTYKTILNEYSRAINFGVMYKFGKPINTRANVDLNINKIETQ